MRKITVLDFCSRIGIASDEIRDYFAPLRKSVEITRIKVVIKEYKPKTKEILPC